MEKSSISHDYIVILRISALIEPSHDLDNQTVSSADVFMIEWSEHKTEDQEEPADPSLNPWGFEGFCLGFSQKV